MDVSLGVDELILVVIVSFQVGDIQCLLRFDGSLILDLRTPLGVLKSHQRLQIINWHSYQ